MSIDYPALGRRQTRSRVKLVLCAFGLVVWSFTAATARPLELNLVLMQVPSEAQPKQVDVTVTASPAGGRQDGRIPPPKPIELTVQAPGSEVLELADETVWRISAGADGFWAEDTLAGLDPTRATTVYLWPTTTVHGRLTVPASEPMPAELRVRFSPVGEGSPREQRPPESTIRCPVLEGVWKCQIPTGAMDLKLRATGFVSHYFWNLPLRRKTPENLGTLELRRGASLVGFVEVENGSVDPKRCEVLVAPFSAALPSRGSDLRQAERVTEKQHPSDRGFFHFEGLAPGTYVVSAQQPGQSEARFGPLTIIQDAEANLPRPLVLQKPLTLRAQLQPALDLQGAVWKVILDRRVAASAAGSSSEPVEETYAGEDGSYGRAGLPPGTYSLRVLDSGGNTVAWEDLDLHAFSDALVISLDVVGIEGTISLGDVPIAARLTFGGRRGRHRVSIDADPEGIFAGSLPRSGEWPVLVESDDPQIHRSISVTVPKAQTGVAHLEIELPNNRIAGQTVTSQGEAAGGAMVKLTEPLSGEVAFIRSDADGEFSASGIEEGTHYVDAQWISADRRNYTASPQVVVMADGRSVEDLKLVLQATALFSGTVLSTEGPVRGALVLPVPRKNDRDYPFVGLTPTGTDQSGQFQFEAPADCTSIQLTALPPGYTLVQETVACLPDSPVTLFTDRNSGSLILEWEGESPPGAGRATVEAAVLRDGSVLSTSLLRSWAQINGREHQNPGRLEVPSMPTGNYTACWITLQDYAGLMAQEPAVAATLAGYLSSLAAQSRCASGQLGTAGSLVLRMPGLPDEHLEEGTEPSFEEPRTH